MMSGSDGDVNVDPFPFLVMGEDLSELFDECEPFRAAELPFVATLPVFRLKRPISRGRSHGYGGVDSKFVASMGRSRRCPFLIDCRCCTIALAGQEALGERGRGRNAAFRNALQELHRLI